MVTTVNKDLYINKRDSNYRGCEEMHAQKALRAILLTFILTVGSAFPLLLIPPVYAQPAQGNTTLYFTNALNFSLIENYSEFFAPISLNPPVNQNDSLYPPTLFIKNTTKLLPHYNLNADQLLTWFSTWVYYLLNLSEYYNYFGNDSFLDLFIPNPLRIIEEYTYNGNSSVTIDGDLTFNLYFSPPDNRRPKLRDEVNVGLYSWNQNSFPPIPKRITNTTITLTPKGSSIYNQPVKLTNYSSFTLTPGTSLLFSVEIVPSNKTIPSIFTKLFNVSKFFERWEKRADRWENRSKLPTLQTIGTTIKDILSTIKEVGANITSKDIAAILNSLVSTKLVYDSILHPSSVTVPAKISEEDIRDYYLHAGQGMSETQPEGTNKSSTKLSTTPITWITDQVLDRNKILKVNNVTAELYFYRAISILPGKVTVIVTLMDNNTTIASSEKILTKKETQAFYQKPTDPIIFTFNGSDVEISNGHQLGLQISLSNETKKVRTPLFLRYDSTAYPAFLRIKYEETQNIKVHDITVTPADGKIIPGGSVKYLFNISSKKVDNLTISTIEREKTGAWAVTVPEAVSVPASTIGIPVFINSTDPLKTAYGNTIAVTLVFTGKTGIARASTSAEVSKDAIHYDVEILDYTNSITMKKGETRNFYFIIKNNNTGAVNDIDNYTITATSKNQWPVLPRELVRNILRGNTSAPKAALVVLEVPQNTTLDSDEITITVTSETNPSTSTSINLTVRVQPPDILESIYESFNSLAKSLGLSEIFGDYAAIALVALLMIIILFIIIILAFVLTLKDVRIICTDRIKEIEPDQHALFELTLKNPTKKQQSYEVTTQQTAQPSQWVITAEPAAIQVEGRQSKPVQVIATPAETITPKDWTEIIVRVHKTGKKKTDHIDLMAMIKEGKTLLQIGNVTHWPAEFNPGGRVVTSFSISNKGTISARDITIFLYINGKQKNKINATIPAGGVADVQMPWIAVKGKNKVRIRLKEQ